MTDIAPRQIVEAVCAFHRVSPRQIAAPVRTGVIVWVRHQLAFMLRELTDLSLSNIGTLLGGRDAKTVLNSMSRVTDRMASEPDYAAEITRLRAFVEAYDTKPRGADAIGRARQLMSTTRRIQSPEIDALALTLLMVASILGSNELSDAEARLAALTAIGKEAVHG